MKIALVLHRITRGGVLRRVLQFRRCVGREHEVLIVSVFSVLDDADVLRELREVAIFRLGLTFPTDRGPAIDALVALFDVQKPDVVHSMHLYADELAIPAARKTGIRAVVRSVHGITQVSRRDKYLRSETRFDWDDEQIIIAQSVENDCDITFAVSADLARRLIRYGLNSRKIAVLHNGVDTEEFSPSDVREQVNTALKEELRIPTDKLVVGVVGRMEACKDPLEALRTFRRCSFARRRSVLVYTGDGPLRSSLIALAADELGKSVFVLSHVEMSRVAEYLRMIDVALVLSRSEGLPFAVLEAMATGIPVVASSVGGIPEVIEDSISGFLCPHGTQMARDRLELLVTDDKVRTSVGSQARAAILARFDVRQKTVEELTHYQRLLRISA